MAPDTAPPPDHAPHLNGFDPATDARGFRDALGRFATGVTVITCQTDAGPQGITANSFASVSLDPPLVLWSLARSSSRFDIFAGARAFCIHVLDHAARDMAARFTRGGHGFDGLATGLGATGAPTLPDALARFDCTRHATHAAGDHLIILGHVAWALRKSGQPMVFSQGHFGGFSPA